MNPNLNKINELIKNLSSNNPHFDEILYTVQQLHAINSDLPTVAEIIENVDQEVIYENNSNN